MSITLEPVAFVKSGFPEKFGIPRQAGLAPSLRAEVVFAPGYDSPELTRGLSGFSHLWLIWEFSGNRKAGWSPTVRPPRLGGNRRMGVFATRSPFRPNPLGLSCVRLEAVLPGKLLVSGADLLDGTPVYDIKPYVPYADAHPEALGGFTDTAGDFLLKLSDPDSVLSRLPEPFQPSVREILAHDPRPSYQNDPNRVYGLRYGGWNFRFTISGNTLTLLSAEIE